MELTIKQALQQGIAAHKEGKLQEAEYLYRAILQSQPKHADANHNLGVMAVSVNKADAALPLFKTALDANPKIEQFWLSYIDALIKEEQFEEARQFLELAKRKGVDENKLHALKRYLTPTSQIENVDNANPSQQQLNILLDHYQNRRFSDAEKLAVSIIQKYPNHHFAYKVLGAVFRQAGKKSEAVMANQKAAALSPQDAEAHKNLGSTLKELGRLEEAEASYAQAIALKPDFVEAHNNLGNILREMGKLNKAEFSYRQAIALKPDYAQAHNNFGVTLRELGRFEEAEASYGQAIALEPDYAEAHSNLGNTLRELGKLEEAEACHTKAIALKPDYAAYYNLGETLTRLDRLEEAEVSYTQAIALKPDFTEAHNRLLDCLYLLNKKTLLFDELDYLINQGTTNAVIGSLTCRSAMRYGLEKPNLFCEEPLKYVLHFDLNNRCNFRELFVKNARSILEENRISNRKQSLLVNGSQTSGNLFDIEHFRTKQIQEVIRSEIEKYHIHFKDSKEGLIKKWPTEYSLRGWLVSMKNGGKLNPHIHENGWLSGSIYISIPSKLDADSGNLVVSVGEDSDVRNKDENPKEIIDVATGSLVLFPASLTHYTIPFESEEERIVLAFDVLPK